MFRCPDQCEGAGKLIEEIRLRSLDRKCAMCKRTLVPVSDEEKLSAREEEKCVEIVNELHTQMMETFGEYRIPPTFFGPLQYVDYEGIGGSNYVENVDDAEFEVRLANPAKKKTA